MNPATTPTSANVKQSRKPRRTRNTSSWPVGFDRNELKMLKELRTATGGKISVGELARAAVRYAAPKFLRGEAPITERLTLTPSSQTSQTAGQ